MSAATRRAEVVAALEAAASAVTVCDDIPDALAATPAYVVTWLRTDTGPTQWVHTFEVLAVVTSQTAEPAHADRDDLVNRALAALAPLTGYGYPTAELRELELGGAKYPNCAVVTITATDNPVTTS